ncbi:MAG: hypothetical protein RI894_582 [Bacteroidota bacterium]|jgi:hypothetical protein
MKKIIIFFFLTCFFAKANAQDGPKLNRFREMTGFDAPESVVGSGEFIYVSNVGKGDVLAKDTNGFISKIDKAKGIFVEKQFIKGLNAPKGMVVIKNTLYVTDIDRVLGFDLKTAKQTLEIAIPEGKFLNDIAVRDNNVLYVSDTKLNRIYEVNVSKKTFKILNVKTPQGANGLVYVAKEKTLYVNGFGSDGKKNGELAMITQLESAAPVYVATPAKKGFMDGLCVPEKDVIVFSDWVNTEGKQGRINLYDPKTEMTRSVPLERGFAGPADFWLDVETSCFYIPLMLENKLWIQQIGGILTDKDFEDERPDFDYNKN